MKRLRLGLIGCGAVAEMFHLPNLISMPEYELACLSDTDASRAQKLKETFRLNCAVSDDYNRILSSKDVDAVLILTPPKTHREIAIAAAEARKHVFVEKPMASTSMEAQEIVESCRKAESVLAVGFQMRFVPQFRKMKALVDDGRFGHLIGGCFVHFGYAYQWPSKSKSHLKPGEGGALFDMCHHVDLAQWIYGVPSRVTATISTLNKNSAVDDTASLFLTYKDGKTCSVHIGWNEVSLNSIHVFGTDASATCNGKESEILYSPKNLFIQQPIVLKTAPTRMVSPYHEELLDFYHAILKHRHPLATGEDGVNTLKIIEGARNSNDKRQATPV